jgi:hypothetical protein
MSELPSSLAPAEPLARAVYEGRWRPPPSDGPARDRLLALIKAAGDTAEDTAGMASTS